MSTPRLASAREALVHAVSVGVTPGAQLAVRFGDGVIEQICVGALSYERGAHAVTLDTLYDLASVTKPFCALTLVRLGVPLDQPLGDVLPWTRDTPVGDAPLDALLAHRAGLLHWAPFYQTVAPEHAGTPEARHAVLHAVAHTPRDAVGTARYSDLGYILVGEALAAISHSTLDVAVQREVIAPLGLGAHYRGVGPGWVSDTVAPTEQCAWRHRSVQGEVHDENGYALGGVCGHAGLFGTAYDLVRLGAAALDCLAGDATWFSPERMAWMIAPRPGGTHRLGWDGRSAENPSSGTLMGPRSFGHLGFTGTSLWCDPDGDITVALVTNRVHPTRENNGIRALRRALHDAVMHAR